MCGIVGATKIQDHKIFESMTETLRHRGPDDEGFYYTSDIALGFRRLSIIDLATGRQPMFNEDGTITLVFNGEVYNFKELKDQLLRKGHTFQTHSDTETIIHLYEELGEAMLSKLNGMFALALWDDRQKKLLLARDRLGKKPLYYTQVNSQLLFSSEPKALLAHPDVPRELDMGAFGQYLTYEYIPAPLSIFKNIFKLPAAHYLIYQNQNLSLKPYWSQETTYGQHKDFKLESALRVTDALLDDAVRQRLMSDVPLGVFLSGGIDSSTIAYYAQRHSSQKIKTFSIGFKEKTFDDSAYAQQVAEYLKTEHHSKIFEMRELLELIPELFAKLDEPLADSSLLPTYLLSKFAREHVTVALGGDGADEIFWGYQSHLAHMLAGRVGYVVPRAVSRLAYGAVSRLPTSFGYFSLDFKLKKFFSGLSLDHVGRELAWTAAFTPAERVRLLGTTMDPQKSERVTDDPWRWISQHYLTRYLAEDILTKVDRASMYNSLEVRAPFLDYRLVEFMNGLPHRFKINGLTTKYLLKKLMTGRLPDSIVYRKKKGFPAPIALWLNNELRGLTDELLDARMIAKQGLLNPGYVAQLLAEHRAQRVDHRKKLWTLLVFQLWQKYWLN